MNEAERRENWQHGLSPQSTFSTSLASQPIGGAGDCNNRIDFQLLDSRDFGGSLDSDCRGNMLTEGGQLDRPDNATFLLPGRIHALVVSVSRCAISLFEKLVQI